jgi:hypothetical protein
MFVKNEQARIWQNLCEHLENIEAFPHIALGKFLHSAEGIIGDLNAATICQHHSDSKGKT